MLLIVQKTKSKYNPNADNWIFKQKKINEKKSLWFLPVKKTKVKIFFKKNLANS